MSNPSSSALSRNPQIQVHHASSSRPSSSFSPSSPNIVTRVPNARTARSPTNRSGHGHRYEHPREREVEREIVESEEVWENQRGTTLFGKPKFSSKSLLPTDRGPFSDANGNFKLEKEKIQLPSPEWSWISDWAVDFSGDVDSEGWMYAFNFGNFPWSSNCGMTSYVRRRRWLRLRQKTETKKVGGQISKSRSTEGGAGEVKEGLAIAREWLGEGVVREVRTGRLDRERLEILRKGVNEVFDNLKATSPTQSGSDKGKGNDHPHDQNQNKELQLLAIEKVFGSRVNDVLVSRITQLLTAFDYESSKKEALKLLLHHFPVIMKSNSPSNISDAAAKTLSTTIPNATDAKGSPSGKENEFLSSFSKTLVFFSDRKELFEGFTS